jgi:hypothetical protein
MGFILIDSRCLSSINPLRATRVSQQPVQFNSDVPRHLPMGQKRESFNPDVSGGARDQMIPT